MRPRARLCVTIVSLSPDVSVPFVSVTPTRATRTVPRPPDPERRQELRDALGDYVLAEGLADMSLRPLAAALGTSPRMLLYHFESKERLVSEGLAVARMRQAEQSSEWLA